MHIKTGLSVAAVLLVASAAAHSADRLRLTKIPPTNSGAGCWWRVPGPGDGTHGPAKNDHLVADAEVGALYVGVNGELMSAHFPQDQNAPLSGDFSATLGGMTFRFQKTRPLGTAKGESESSYMGYLLTVIRPNGPSQKFKLVGECGA